MDANTWSKVPIRRQLPGTNPVPYTKGPTAATAAAEKPSDFMDLFLTDSMLNNITHYTNKKIDIEAPRFGKQKATTKQVTVKELRAYLGILIQAGALKNGKLSIDEMFSQQYGCPMNRAAMSKERFAFLTRCLRFDDLTTRKERKQQDVLAPIRELWEQFLQQCRQNYVPGEEITVDEQLLAFRGRCPFRMYIKNKPAKYGIKIIMCCDAKTYYMANAKVDLGKRRKEKVNAGKVGEFYTLAVTEPYLGAGRTVTADNWFTSKDLLQQLWQRNTFLVGTCRKKPFIPKVMYKLERKRKPNTSIFLFSRNMMLTSFKAKMNKIVVMLSSKHNESEIGQKNKPEVIHFYNRTKGGVDVLDHMCATYSCSRKTRRWPLCLFYGILNIAVVNAFILQHGHQETTVKKRRLFMHEMAREMVLPWAQERLNIEQMPRRVKTIILDCFNMEEEPVQREEQLPKIKRRCAFCKYHPNMPKVAAVCNTCKRSVCVRHYVHQCPECRV